MFPEYRDLITRLKGQDDAHFTRLFDKHNDLDHQIKALESGSGDQFEIEGLKKEKLGIKDQLYAYLQKVAGADQA